MRTDSNRYKEYLEYLPGDCAGRTLLWPCFEENCVKITTIYAFILPTKGAVRLISIGILFAVSIFGNFGILAPSYSVATVLFRVHTANNKYLLNKNE